jgi:hypothetical protein
MGQKVFGKAPVLALAVFMVESQGVPQRHEGENVIGFRRLEMQVNDEIEVVPRHADIGRVQASPVRRHLDAGQPQLFRRPFQAGDHFNLGVVEARPQAHNAERADHPFRFYERGGAGFFLQVFHRRRPYW